METPLAVANYFLQKSFDSGIPITPMKLLKLVYIAHGWHLGLTEDPLINEAVQAWKYGPVVESVYKEFKGFGGEPITRLANSLGDDWQFVTPTVDAGNFVQNAVLEKVWEVYKGFSGPQLSTLTHQENTPWDIIYNRKGGKGLSGAIIPNDLIKSHYKEKMHAA